MASSTGDNRLLHLIQRRSPAALDDAKDSLDGGFLALKNDPIPFRDKTHAITWLDAQSFAQFDGNRDLPLGGNG